MRQEILLSRLLPPDLQVDRCGACQISLVVVPSSTVWLNSPSLRSWCRDMMRRHCKKRSTSSMPSKPRCVTFSGERRHACSCPHAWLRIVIHVPNVATRQSHACTLTMMPTLFMLLGASIGLARVCVSPTRNVEIPRCPPCTSTPLAGPCAAVPVARPPLPGGLHRPAGRGACAAVRLRNAAARHRGGAAAAACTALQVRGGGGLVLLCDRAMLLPDTAEGQLLPHAQHYR